MFFFRLPYNIGPLMQLKEARQDHLVFIGLCFINQARYDQSVLETHIESHV